MGIRRKGLVIYIKQECEKIAEGKKNFRENMARIKGCEKRVFLLSILEDWKCFQNRPTVVGELKSRNNQPISSFAKFFQNLMILLSEKDLQFFLIQIYLVLISSH